MICNYLTIKLLTISFNYLNVLKMRTYTTQLIAFLTTLILMSSCSKAPMTGRSQLKINFESELIRQGEQAYAELKTQNRLCRDKDIIETVNNVTNKLIQATDTYYRMNGQENKLALYKWEVPFLNPLWQMLLVIRVGK
jgi:hypothetical protein